MDKSKFPENNSGSAYATANKPELNNTNCDHIIGYGRRHDSFINGFIYESTLKDWDEEGCGYSIPDEFDYCPNCGQKL